jgi:hypothetical protein
MNKRIGSGVNPRLGRHLGLAQPFKTKTLVNHLKDLLHGNAKSFHILATQIEEFHGLSAS